MSMTNTLDISDLLAAIKEVTRPYELGIHLKIDPSTLKTIDKNHPRDIGRQKVEVIDYWLLTSPDASWTTLAKAVKGMGGHDRLAKKIANMEINNQKRLRWLIGYLILSLDRSVPRTILLLGKMGHGKSTLGNTMLNAYGLFKINDQRCPQTSQGSSVIKSQRQHKCYKIEVYDHSGLFEGASSIKELSSAVPKQLNLVIFVLKCGHHFDDSEVAILKSVMSKWRISEISALVLTHCDHLSKERRKMIKQFKKDHQSIAELMGKGILAVGFPDNSHIQSESELSQWVEDKANLRQLIYSCDKLVNLDTDSQKRWIYFGVSVCVGCLCIILYAYIMLK